MLENLLNKIREIDYKVLTYRVHAVSLVVFGVVEGPFILVVLILLLFHIKTSAIIFIINAVLIFLGVILPRWIYRGVTPKSMDQLLDQIKHG